MTLSSKLILQYLISDYVYPIKTCLFSYLRPWDIAKLSYVLKVCLTDEDRYINLNLLDDIFWDRRLLTIASKLNMQISIFGNSIPILKHRLEDILSYFREYGDDKEIQHSPIFIILSSQEDSSEVLRNSLNHELSIHTRLSSKDSWVLDKWLDIHSDAQLHVRASVPSQSLYEEEDFWRDPYAPEISKGSSGVLSYIGFSQHPNLRSANVPKHLRNGAVQIHGDCFTFYTAQVIGEGNDRLEITSFHAPIPPKGTRHTLYPEVYNEGASVCVPLDNDSRIDIQAPDQIISVW
jgi:hypothetical protein